MSRSDLPTKATTSGSLPPVPPSLSSSSSILDLSPKVPPSTPDTGSNSSSVGIPPVSDFPSLPPLISSPAKGSDLTITSPPKNLSSPVLGPSLTSPLPSPPLPIPQLKKYSLESLTPPPLQHPRPPSSPHPVPLPTPSPSSHPPLPPKYSPHPPPSKRSSPPSPSPPSAPPPSLSPPEGPLIPRSASAEPPQALLKPPPPPHALPKSPPPPHSSPAAAAGNSTTCTNCSSISVSPSKNRTSAAFVPPLSHSPTKSPTPRSAASTPSSSSSVQIAMIVGAVLGGVVILGLVATIFVLTRKKNKRADAYPPDVYPSQYVPPPNFSIQSDGYYYGQNMSVIAVPGQSDTYFPSQVPYSGSSYGSQRGKGYHGGGPESELLTGTKSFYSYKEVIEMTGGFAHLNIIGEGGFGSVYKGQLPDGRVVAVKQLKAESGQGDREFRAEVEIISPVHHRHLVSLVGYCIEDNQRLLIYEFLPNKTLDYHLHGKGLPVLEWKKRVKIALGAAKGLAYLHEDCHPKIIHRDIKSSNILLDDAFESQVSDFGLAKLTNDTNTHVSTRVMGTFGYLAPEYASSGKLTDKSDVFSFGVVLLELITGRKPVDPTQPLGDESLVEWSRPVLIQALETGDVSEVVDPRLEKHYVESEMLRMIEAAAACIRHSAAKRPRMAQVVRALDINGVMLDLTNGVKYGQSTIYDSEQYSEDIMKFRRMAHGSNYSLDFGLSSREHTSSEVPSAAWKSKDSSTDFTSSESESRAFTGTSRRVY